MHKGTLFLALALSATSLHAQTITGTGGTLVAPTAIGQAITVQNVATNGGTAAISCPVTFFGAGTYQWNWVCGPGVLTIGELSAAIASGTATYTCSGGGRAHPSVCYHVMTAHLTDGGIVTVTSKGATNNARSTVVSFSASW